MSRSNVRLHENLLKWHCHFCDTNAWAATGRETVATCRSFLAPFLSAPPNMHFFSSQNCSEDGSIRSCWIPRCLPGSVPRKGSFFDLKSRSFDRPRNFFRAAPLRAPTRASFQTEQYHLIMRKCFFPLRGDFVCLRRFFGAVFHDLMKPYYDIESKSFIL
jgi:hypothetical protein